MKKNYKRFKNWVAAGLLSIIGFSLCGIDSVIAEGGYGLTVAPMNESIIIDPGDTYESSFRISNPASSTSPTYYKLVIEPYFTSEAGGSTNKIEGEYNEIVKWTTFNVPTEGKLEPNDTKEVSFTIKVPESASAKGQYMAIKVAASGEPIKDDDSKSTNSDPNATIKEVKKMAHIVYAEITGNSIKKGEVTDLSLPSFLLSGKITGAATVKNTGNVHGKAKYTLQIYPLFSNEEVYSNEEEPSTSTILPDREKYTEIAWDGTPGIGIFNVVFTVEFEGVKEQVSRMVIVCPVWLLFTIVFAVVALIIWIVLRVKSRGRKARNTSAAESE